jgi:hypothetical protein
MPPVPTSDPPAVTAGEADFDPALGVYAIFVSLAREETVYFRLVVESWEDFAVVRTVERFDPVDRSRSILVLMVVPGYLAPCVASLASLCAEVEGWQVPGTPGFRAALRRDLLEPA